MTELDLIIFGSCFAVWIISMLRNFAYRRLGRKVEQIRYAAPPDEEKLPAFSVIITAHNQCNELRRHLPLILNQIYDQFEVIVVDINSTDGTKDLLEKFEEDNPHLRHTFTPSTSRDISAQRLAITLGVKAATNQWLVITQADCCPVSHQWLRRMGDAIAAHRSAKMAIGYTRYAHSSGYTARRMRFFHFWQQNLSLNYAFKHAAYQCDGTNLVYNKEFFLCHQGFASHSTLLAGATDIMVNRNSTRHNTAVCLHPEAIIEQQMPHNKHWRQDRLFFQETRRHFRHKWGYRLRYFGSVLLHILFVLSMAGAMGWAIWQEQYIAAGIALLLWLVHFFEQGAMVKGTFRALENRTINFVSLAWFIHLIPFWDLRAKLRHTFCDKRQFRKKYI